MKKLLPLAAAGALLAACSGHCNDGHCDKHSYHGDYDRDRGKISSSDPLSERSLGSMRGAHNEYWENSRGPGDRDTTYFRRGYYYDDPAYVYYTPRYNYYYYPGAYWRR